MARTLVCVGLDPLAEKMPECVRKRSQTIAGGVYYWMSGIVSATAPYASMFKPQIAHWEAIDGGIKKLKDLIAFIHFSFPDIPVFLDCKRGDITRTQRQYKVACLDKIGADGMNFAPYMGKDCMSALVDKEDLGRALVGLCYTSNLDAREVQDGAYTDAHGVRWEHYWEFMADRVLVWGEQLGVVDNSGLVMAAAYENPKGSGKVYSEHLSRCRNIVGNRLWFLIPGIGTQGGFVTETVRASYVGPGSIAINSSSGITEASSGEDYAQAAADKAKELRDQINVARRKLRLTRPKSSASRLV